MMTRHEGGQERTWLWQAEYLSGTFMTSTRHGMVHQIQPYVIKLASDLPQICGFSLLHSLSPSIKLKLLVPYLAKSQGCIVNVSTNVTIGPVSILTYYIQHAYCICLCIRTLINMNENDRIFADSLLSNGLQWFCFALVVFYMIFCNVHAHKAALSMYRPTLL
jgi:hypothetical protein